ncbi:DNA polymerase III subunit delta [Nanchangia anserum]|uniref:DNA-directed DNA polymerase n=1 Tax=Nanchangia anserum TaxID=2692125 RepID=A0A8I0KR59_9ACTO|nr:DNA polymerase III subunit delta [Nanchangia anserum]MBD3689107.1 DNA polymerase III subunit delta [Nanchangia anserum]QOX81342.1 DNA polymerase III subunit delta [Nanchangia anserum]
MARKTALPGVPWDQARLAPIVLIRSSEDLLADRAVAALRAQAREEDPAVEITRIDAASYAAGQLSVYASPSLFGERRLIEIAQLESMNDHLLADLLDYIPDPVPDVWVVLRHNGGQRGKRVLDALSAARVAQVACPEVKWPRDKIALLMADAKRARRRLAPEAASALVDALGSDVSSMAAALNQLLADTEGTIGIEDVRRYHGGRVEATGFEVADAAVTGRAAEALTLTRHAVQTGAAPQLIIAALAIRLRTLAKVAGAAPASDARALGMSPTQLRKAREQVRGWSEEGLARAITAVAAGDEDTKGASRDPAFALERTVRRVVQAHGRRGPAWR